MQIRPYPLIRGLASYVLPKSIFKRPGSGGSFSSKYCYSVWLRHAIQLKNSGLIRDIRELTNVAEIGPGDSLGIGISALYTGAKNYYAFDVIEHANTKANLQINSEIGGYFINRMAIPNGTGFVNTNPVLEDYAFPESLLNFDSSHYHSTQHSISNALQGLPSDVSIRYIVPWTKATHQNISNIDLIFSQAVMEHVSDLHFAYNEMFKWLKSGGIISHQIDFKTHEMTREWNGHWYVGDTMWSILAHGRKYPMNRLPLSSHIEAIKAAGFLIKEIIPVKRESSFKTKPSIEGASFTDDDLTTSSALVQAVKP